MTFEDQIPNHQNRLRFPSTYVGTPCPIETEKKQDVSLTAKICWNNGTSCFEDRKNICTWIRHSNSTGNRILPADGSGTTPIRMYQCGWGDQCPTLARARYGFHAQGDTFGSNRLIDIILSGTVPIFTRREQYDILPKWLDWRKLSAFLPLNDIKDETQFIEKLQTILHDDDGYKERHEAVLQHRHLVDWMTLHPFDLYMYSLQAELYPETRHNASILGDVLPALNVSPALLS